MNTERLRPNRFHRYALPEAAFLADAENGRYVLIAPEGDGFVVERGDLVGGSGDVPPVRIPAALGERFSPDDLAAAVQRVCALAAEWLCYDEWEVEQTRRLFIVREGSSGGG